MIDKIIKRTKLCPESDYAQRLWDDINSDNIETVTMAYIQLVGYISGLRTAGFISEDEFKEVMTEMSLEIMLWE